MLSSLIAYLIEIFLRQMCISMHQLAQQVLFNRLYRFEWCLQFLTDETIAGNVIAAGGYGDIVVEEFSVEKVRSSCDFVFLAVSGEFALEYAPLITVDNGPIVIDNSSAFRYMDHIPLVVSNLFIRFHKYWLISCLFWERHVVKVPEINPQTLIGARLIANPNCTTAIAAVVLWPIYVKYGIKKLVMSTYQASSGAGSEGMEELLTGTASKLQGQPVKNKVFVHALPFNLIPHIDKFQVCFVLIMISKLLH